MSAPESSSFTGEQYEHCYPDGIDRNYWNIARNQLIEQVLGQSTVPGPVLDVGCGRGLVVDYLRRRGFDVTGCDTAAATPMNREVAPHLTLGTGAFDLSPEQRRRPRTLTLLDVVEHLDDPEDLLSGCVEHFPNASHFLVTVPARVEIWSEWDEAYGHKRRYDRNALRILMTGAGLEIVEMKYFFHSLYAAARLVSLFGVDRATTVEAPRGRLTLTVHRAIAALLSADRRVLPPSWPGSSLYALARRP